MGLVNNLNWVTIIDGDNKTNRINVAIPTKNAPVIDFVVDAILFLAE